MQMKPVEGQVSLFDLDSQCLRTYAALSQATKGATSKPYYKPSAKSEGANRQTMFLCLKKGAGNIMGASWEMVTHLPGKSWMLSTAEHLNEERESTLSQILEVNAPEKYYLSSRACQGILRRAERRGKELPPMLKEALEEAVALGI